MYESKGALSAGAVRQFDNTVYVGPAETAEQRSVPNKLEGLDTVINDLGRQLEHLENKLLPVMRIAPPKAVSSNKEETTCGCELADILFQKIRQIDNFANRISDCVNRLEL